MRATSSTGFVPLLRWLLIVALVVLVGAAGLGVAFLGAPRDLPPEGRLVSIRPGASSSIIAGSLAQAGAIKSDLAFRVLARLLGKEGSLKSGTYRILPGSSALTVLDLLESGKQALVRLTIPEGYTLRQTGLLLERLGITTAAAFGTAARDAVLLTKLGIPAESAEGYLFPDTYFLPLDYPAADVVAALVAAFRAKLAEALPESAALSPEALQEKVILASIVEREYRLPEEAPLMASVFYNRVRIRMALQSCATVVYVLTELEGKPHPERIFDRDLEVKSPYNTYAQRGLPPGPISSPGLTALTAAFRPATTTYLYFRLVDPAAGKHHFSVSLEEHQSAADLVVKKVGG